MIDIVAWLGSLGLAKYAPIFAKNEVDLDILPRLSDQDLRELGLPLGARKKILHAAVELSQPSAARPTLPATADSQSAALPERRQITVLFSDVVDSTSLAGRLDVEDLRSLVLAYQQACTEAIERHGGYVAQYLGDGVLAYFGYPTAHEDDAVRAVRAALTLIDRMPIINQQLIANHGVGLEIRAGIHTGLVVTGEMGAGQAREQLAVGETPNIAARIQGIARAGSVAVSEATWRLIEGFFASEPLGPQSFKGVNRPIPVHCIVALTDVAPFEARIARLLTPLVGREIELGLLRKRWEQALEGEGQAVLLQGEAGIGKSRLLRAFRELLEPSEYQAITLNCSSQYQASAFAPVIEQFRRIVGLSASGDSSEQQAALSTFLRDLGLETDHFLPALAALLRVTTDGGAGKGAGDSAELRRDTLEALLHVTLAISEARPLLFVIEDAHWIDPSTQELAGHVLDVIRNRRVMMVFTARPGYQAPWLGLAHFTTLSLSRLSRRETDAMIRRVANSEVAPEILTQLLIPV